MQALDGEAEEEDANGEAGKDHAGVVPEVAEPPVAHGHAQVGVGEGILVASPAVLGADEAAGNVEHVEADGDEHEPVVDAKRPHHEHARVAAQQAGYRGQRDEEHIHDHQVRAPVPGEIPDHLCGNFSFLSCDFSLLFLDLMLFAITTHPPNSFGSTVVVWDRRQRRRVSMPCQQRTDFFSSSDFPVR
jgi:hypothetical protein